MILKTLRKKITATLAAGVIGCGIIFSTPAPVEAIGVGEIIGIGGAVLSGSAQMSEAKKQIAYANETDRKSVV